MNAPDNFWILLIGALTTLAGTLGFGKVLPDYLERRKEKERQRQQALEEEKREREEQERLMHERINKLTDRMEELELEVEKYKTFKLKTETAFNSMIPLMKEMMKDHPAHIALLDQLKNNIFGEDQE